MQMYPSTISSALPTSIPYFLPVVFQKSLLSSGRGSVESNYRLRHKGKERATIGDLAGETAGSRRITLQLRSRQFAVRIQSLSASRVYQSLLLLFIICVSDPPSAPFMLQTALSFPVCRVMRRAHISSSIFGNIFLTHRGSDVRGFPSYRLMLL